MFPLALFFATHAHACGGFFCDNTQPVVQSAERILFHMHPDGGATTYVEIQYQGEPTDFAWVIPVPPGLDVDTDVHTAPAGLFDDLERLTAPRFGAAQLADEGVAGCACGPVGARAAPPDTSGVEVVGEGVVGPYAIERIRATEADNLINWLLLNGYRIPPSAEPAMQHYIDADLEFLGLQLQPDVPEGPIDTLAFTADLPCPMVPILLTAVAAAPDMEIVTYILADEPWVPANYTEIGVPVDAVADDPAHYDAILPRVLDQYAPHTFVAEFRGSTRDLVPQAAESADLLARDAVLARYRTFLDPDEMTVDPVWMPDPTALQIGNTYAPTGPDTGRLPASALAFALVAWFRRRPGPRRRDRLPHGRNGRGLV